MVTASHNPPDYNGMKFVREQSRPISADTGLAGHAGADREARSCRRKAARPGQVQRARYQRASTSSTCSATSMRTQLKPLKVVVNAGNGGAGLIIDQLEPHLPFEFVKINHEPDGSFPNGVPNPMLEENRASHHRGDSPLQAPIWDSPGTATMIAASSSTSTAASSRATTWSACWPRPSCAATAARASCTIRA